MTRALDRRPVRLIRGLAPTELSGECGRALVTGSHLGCVADVALRWDVRQGGRSVEWIGYPRDRSTGAWYHGDRTDYLDSRRSRRACGEP